MTKRQLIGRVVGILVILMIKIQDVSDGALLKILITYYLMKPELQKRLAIGGPIAVVIIVIIAYIVVLGTDFILI